VTERGTPRETRELQPGDALIVTNTLPSPLVGQFLHRVDDSGTSRASNPSRIADRAERRDFGSTCRPRPRTTLARRSRHTSWLNSFGRGYGKKLSLINWKRPSLRAKLPVVPVVLTEGFTQFLRPNPLSAMFS
jgi:hypothetical protein